MPAPSPTTLKHLLLTNNSVGVSLHRSGTTLSNYITYAPDSRHNLFIHGRDLLEEKHARFGDDGKLIVERGEHHLVAGGHPFKESAIAAIEHHLGFESLDERTPSIALGKMTPESFERKLIARLEKTLPGAGIKRLYDGAVARVDAERHGLQLDADGMIRGQVEQIMAGVAQDPRVAGFYRDMLAPLCEARQMRNPFNDDNTVDRQALEHCVSRLVEAERERTSDRPEPPLVLDMISEEVLRIIGERTGNDVKEAWAVFQGERTALLRDEYEAMASRKVFETDAREELERRMRVPARVKKRFMEDLRPLAYDLQQVDNLCVGLNALRNDSRRPAAELIAAGKRERALMHLSACARHLGKPFRGSPLVKAEAEVAEEIVACVPPHILRQGCKDGLKLGVDVGDPSKSRVYLAEAGASGLTRKGGYHWEAYAHPFIALSNDMLSDFGSARLGQIARHEYRHYWSDRVDGVNHPELQAAVAHDREHYRRARAAIGAERPDAGQQAMVREAMTALQAPDARALEAAFRRLGEINDPWLERSHTSGPEATPANPPGTGYHSEASRLEEAFPRIDETVMEFGEKAAAHLFPRTYALMQRLDAEFKDKAVAEALPALRAKPAGQPQGPSRWR
jgi:hypothetical protein